MRRIDLATLLLTATVISTATACRQTNATTASGPLVPLSPNQNSTVPSLIPFGGGQTRVTPPPTGSYSVPNNYMGGTAPVSQVVSPAAAGLAGPTSIGPQAVGSGVASTGWNDARTAAPAVANPIAPVSATAPIARDPRLGGMQVIDLTQAPPPPGYRPQYGHQPTQATPSISHPNFNSAPVLPPVQPIQTIQAPAQGNFAQGNFAGAPSGVIAQTPFQSRGASAGAPSQPTNLVPLNPPPASPMPTTGGAAAPQNLPWRQPGAQF